MRSTVGDYLGLLEVPEGVPRRAAWVDRYEAAHPAVFARYYENWGNTRRRDQAADAVSQLAPVIRQREVGARSLVTRAGRDVKEIGVLQADEIPAVLLVGGHPSNGWVTDLEGVTTLFLALEYLGEPPFDDILVTHEAVHLGHLGGPAATWPATVAEALFSEGLAVAVSRHVRPGLDDSAYLWFDDSHQRWVNECRERDSEIRRTVLARFGSTDSEFISTLFGAQSGSPLPTRCGYWMGDLIVRHLIEDASASPRELLCWTYQHAQMKVAEVLVKLDPTARATPTQ